MKNAVKLATVVVVLLVVAIFLYNYTGTGKGEKVKEGIGTEVEKTKMKISSPAFQNSQIIPDKYTCKGQDVNPPLVFEEVPLGAKGLVLIMDDPDAPMGIWVHWVLFNMDYETPSIEENSVPRSAVLGINDFGRTDYGGPCPHSGTHRYYFKLYALDTELNLSEGATKAEIEAIMKNRIMEQAELVGLFSK